MKKFIATILTIWIPIKKIRREARFKLIVLFNVSCARKKYSIKIKEIRNKLKNKQKISVGFYVVFDAVIQTIPIFEKMLDDDVFEPYILVIPDSYRGEENMFHQMKKTYNSLSSKYKNVLNSYDYDKKCFIDYSSKFDIIFFNNPYDDMTQEIYGIVYNSKNGPLTCFTDYGYDISNMHSQSYRTLRYNILWKNFILEKNEYFNCKKNLVVKDANIVLSGYCKMDKIAQIKENKRERKKIILAPHHSINMPEFSLSNFLRYYDFFLELPKKYPQIDFVFRPHPLLFVTLEKDSLWGKKKVQQYLDEMTSNKNVEYQEGGEYFETFVNSDALIHDCGSFTAEYLFTNHPCCFMLKDDKTTDKNSNDFHKACINNHYKAYNQEQIIDFIENVVIKEKDTMFEKRKKFKEENLLINYPNVSDFIINHIKEAIK